MLGLPRFSYPLTVCRHHPLLSLSALSSEVQARARRQRARQGREVATTRGAQKERERKERERGKKAWLERENARQRE